MIASISLSQTNTPTITNTNKPVVVLGGPKGLNRDGHTRIERDWVYKNIILLESPIKNELKAGTITKKQAGERLITVYTSAFADTNAPKWAVKGYDHFLLKAQIDAGKPPKDLDKKLEKMIEDSAKSATTPAGRATRIINAKRKAALSDSKYLPIPEQLNLIDANEPNAKKAARQKAAVYNFAADEKTTDERMAIFFKLQALNWKAQIGDEHITNIISKAELLVNQEQSRTGSNERSIQIASDLAGSLDPRWVQTMDLLTNGIPAPSKTSFFAEQKGYIIDFLRAREYDRALEMAKRYNEGMKSLLKN